MVKAVAAEFEELSSIPETQTVERGNQLLQVALWPLRANSDACACMAPVHHPLISSDTHHLPVIHPPTYYLLPIHLWLLVLYSSFIHPFIHNPSSLCHLLTSTHYPSIPYLPINLLSTHPPFISPFVMAVLAFIIHSSLHHPPSAIYWHLFTMCPSIHSS